MVQLLNLVVPSLAAPALHNSGFAVSYIVCQLVLATSTIHLLGRQEGPINFTLVSYFTPESD